MKVKENVMIPIISLEFVIVFLRLDRNTEWDSRGCAVTNVAAAINFIIGSTYVLNTSSGCVTFIYL